MAFIGNRAIGRNGILASIVLLSASGGQALSQPVDPDDEIVLHFASPPTLGAAPGTIDDQLIPSVTGNIYGWCDGNAAGVDPNGVNNCSVSGMVILREWRTAQFAGASMAFKSIEEYRGRYNGTTHVPCMSPARRARWINDHTWGLYNFGIGQLDANDTPDNNPTSFYLDADQFDPLVRGQTPPGEAKFWLTPWHRRFGPNNTEVGGLFETHQWFSEFLDSYEWTLANSGLGEPLASLRPKFISFDTEQRIADLSKGGSYILSRIHLDPRWETMIVLGSGNKTLAQLWREEFGVQDGCLPGVPCNPVDIVDTRFSLGGYESDENALNEPAIRLNRRIGIWWYRVNKMAHNAAMKYAFYDVIQQRWPDCQVFNFGDVPHQHRNTTGAEQLGWKFDRLHNSLEDQWQINITNQGLLGVRNVYKSWLRAPHRGCPNGQNNGNFLCNAAALPLYLNEPTAARPDRWSFDPPSWRGNGADLPGTTAAPVFYGVFTEQSQIDLNFPWLNAFNAYPLTPQQAGLNATISSYYELGRRNARDVFDSMYFSGYTPQQIIPWIVATGGLTFPKDGNAVDRPAIRATEIDTTRQLADLRAHRMSRALVFIDEVRPANGCSTDAATTAKFMAVTKAKKRAYGAKLIQAQTQRGIEFFGQLIQNVRSVGRVPGALPAPTGAVEAVGWKVASEFLSDENDRYPGDSVSQMMIDFTFNVGAAEVISLDKVAPSIILESYIMDDTTDLEPGRMYARFLIQNPQGGFWQVLPTNDFPVVDPINEQNFTGWFGMFTPDRSVRRTFEWPNVDLRKFLAPEVNGERQVKVRLIVKKKGSSQFTLLVDRLQLLLHPLTEIIVTGGGELPGLAAPSPADVNNNDMVTNADMDIFLNDYVGNAPTADINGDGFVDSSDVTEFYNAFGGAQ
jgi:hypothetical protein